VTRPAGWFPDPEDSGGQRFWNGDEWTEHRAPATAPRVEAAPAPPQKPDRRLLIGLAAAAGVVLVVGAVIAVVLTRKADVDSVAVTPQSTQTSVPPAPVSSETSATEMVEEGPTEPQAAGQGEEVRDGDFAFVVNGVRTTDVIGDSEFPELNRTADGEYVFVALTVTNVAAEGQTFFPSFNTLSDGTTVYETDDSTWQYLGNTVTEIAPGASLETEVVFDVPKGTDLESIWLRGDPLSDGVAVAL
jgi:hypothetical protein